VIRTVRDRIADYDSLGAARSIEHFVVEELSQWYIRRSRRRFWKTESDQDKIAAYLTLYEVLVDTTEMLAPFMPYVTETMFENLVRTIDPDAPVSVHLTDFPEVDESRIDADLTRDMAALINVVGLGRAARSKANVKVRQPLGRVLVGVRQGTALDAVDRMSDQLLEELNVKSFEVLNNPDEYVSYGVRPNFEALGPKYGRQVNAVRAEILKLDAAQLAQLKRTGRHAEITVDGETVQLTPDEYLVDVTDREGFSVVEDRDYIVALDLTITPELEREGMARDFVRGVQDARKRADLQIEDTIVTVYQAEGDLALAIEEHADYIRNETLSRELNAGTPGDDDGFVDEVKVAGTTVAIGVKRVGTLAKVSGGE
jgi:isoleucyl-tRNA synthetase